MKIKSNVYVSIVLYTALIVIAIVECRAPIHSDVIVTNWGNGNQQNTPKDPSTEVIQEGQPGWMRQQLLNFGEVASNIGNSMGSHATVIASAIDKICEVVKTIIPVIAAICHVGQFQFCEATEEAPAELGQALNPAYLELDR